MTIRQRLAARFPVLARVGGVARAVFVGAAEAKPVDRTIEAAIGVPFLAIIRKAIASVVGWVTGRLLVDWLGIDISFLGPELTEWIVSLAVGFYLTWRVPNAPRAPPEEAP